MNVQLYPGIYRTELVWNTGLTDVVCNYCEARYTAGGNPHVHAEGCPARTARRPKRRVTEVLRTITYKMACEIQDNGTVVMP